MAEQFASKSDLDSHKAADPRVAHGILDMAKPMIPTFPIVNSAVSLTLNGTWQTVTVATGAKIVFLQWWWIGDNDADTSWIYTRKNGSVSAGEGGMIGAGRCGGPIIQSLDADGKFQYSGQLMSGSSSLFIIGYIKFP